MFVRDDSLAKTRIELFTTSTASDIKTKKDCYRLRALLEAKKIIFTEIDLAVQLWKRREMLARSNNFNVVPQLHAYGKFIGDLSRCQELEDFGELDEAIQTALEEACLAPVRDESEASAGSQASTHSSLDSQLQGQDTPSPDSEHPHSSPSDEASASASNHSSLTLSPADSPLRGIQSTGSLEICSTESQADASNREEASSADEAETKQAGIDGEDTDEDESECNSPKSQGAVRLSEPQMSTASPEGEGGSQEDKSEAPELPCSSNGYIQQDSETESEAESPTHEVQAYPVDPSTDTQPGTPVSQRPSLGNGSQQVASPFSQASPPTAEDGPEAVEDPWDAASSEDGHSQGPTALKEATSVRSSALSSGVATSGEPSNETQKPRRRSLTSGMIRGANRAEEDATEDAKSTLEESMEALALSDSKRSSSGTKNLSKQSSLHNGDSGHLTFSYVNSTALSPTEDETKNMLAGLRRQESNADSEAGDWVEDIVSSIKSKNGSSKKAAKS